MKSDGEEVEEDEEDEVEEDEEVYREGIDSLD